MQSIDDFFIPKSREYLSRYSISHYKVFFEEMNEYQPNKGYANFPYSSKIIQCMRDITHTLGEVFSDLSIPEKFHSASDLITNAIEFKSHLESQERYFDEAFRSVKKNEEIPLPLSVINKNRQKTIGAITTFVNLAEKELTEGSSISTEIAQSSIEKIENLLLKFHDVANQICHRRKDGKTPRATLEIKDEYDVQDLLHGLLKIHFQDIRPEEWTPSYAGSSKRSDFLLKKEKIIIEIKKTRNNLKQKEIGEQLIIDIANYKKHPDCKTLICFVYDPEKYILNAPGLISDLREDSPDLKVQIYIFP